MLSFEGIPESKSMNHQTQFALNNIEIAVNCFKKAVENMEEAYSGNKERMTDFRIAARPAVRALGASKIRELMNAGAGSYSGLNSAAAISAQQVGSLINYFAPIMPFRQGWDSTIDDGQGVFKSDAITIVYVPSTGAQTTVKTDMTNAQAAFDYVLQVWV